METIRPGSVTFKKGTSQLLRELDRGIKVKRSKIEVVLYY